MLKNVQELLIAIALIISIPSTVYLGCKLVSPKIDYPSYWKEHHQFMKGYPAKHEESYKLREAEWKESDLYKEKQSKECTISFIKLGVAGVISIALLYYGSIFIMPIIGASLIVSGLIVIMYYVDAYYNCSQFNTLLSLIELGLILISLLIMLHASYRLSEN